MDKHLDQKRKAEDKAGKASAEGLRDKMTGGVKVPPKEKLDAMSQQEKIAWAMANMNNMNPAAMQDISARSQATQKALNLPKDARDRIARIGRVTAKYEALESEIRALGNLGGRDYSSPARNAVSAEMAQKFTVKYLTILDEHLGAIKAALPDFKVQAQHQAEAAGLPKGSAASTEAMQAIRDYTARLGDVFKYLQD
jgi:hypothetical protein